MGIYDVDATLLIERTAVELKKEKLVAPPVWATFVKTGSSRQRQPVNIDWWFVRAAAILRKIQILGPVGTSKLRNKFGGRKNRGYKPDGYAVAAGNHIRKILQQLEKSGLAKQVEKDVHKGRVITPKGMQLLDRVASEIMKETGLVLPVKPKIKFEPEKPKKKKKVAKKRTRKKKAVKKVEEKVVEKAPEKKEEKPVEKKEEKAPEKKEEKPVEVQEEKKE